MKKKQHYFLVFCIPVLAVGVITYGVHYYPKDFRKAKPMREIASEDQATTPYSFGGSCSSQGSWTASALAQTSSIKNVLMALKDDPNCKGIEQVVLKLKTVESSFEVPKSESQVNVANWEGLPADIGALRTLSSSSSGRTKDVLNMLMGKTLNNAVLGQYKNVAIRADRVAKTGVEFVNQALDVLPNFNRCLVGKPNQTVALVGGLLKLTSAFASSGENVVGGLGTTLAKLSTYMRDTHFTKALAGLDEAELWMSMSCLVETTTETYCSARDNYMLLNFAKQNEDMMSEEKIVNGTLEGYFILTREIPIISRWLQKVQFGAMPRFESDTVIKNSTIQSFANFQTTQNKLLAKYYQTLQIIEEETDTNKRKTLVMRMIMDLSSAMTDVSEEGQKVNFYTQAINQDLIPFYLLGRNKIPEECLGRMPMSAFDYLKGDGIPSQPEFTDPMALAQKIGDQIKLLNDETSLIAGRYFQNRVIVDFQNLFDESITSQTIDVYQSLQHVSQYLGKLVANSRTTKKNLMQLPSIIDTKQRVDDVLAIYSKVQEKVNSYVERQSEINSKNDEEDFKNLIIQDQELKALIPKLVQTAFERFNVSIQKDSFLPMRVATYVQKDYAIRVQGSTDITKDQQDILITASEGLIGRLNSAYKQNPNDIINELVRAQVVNKKNLDAVETIFADNIAGTITKLKQISEGDKQLAQPRGFDKLKPFTDIIYYSLQFDRINVPPRRITKQMSQEDSFGSFAAFRATLCIQALAFSDQSKFRSICEGTKLEPYMTLKEKDARTQNILKDELSIYYDKNLITKMPYLSNHGRNSMRDVNICAYRNYRRANYAYWLIKDFSNSRFSSAK